MENIRLQIQAVLYQNRLSDLIPSLHSLLFAVTRARQQGLFLSDVCVAWGDASPTPILSDQETQDLQQLCQDTNVQFHYLYFAENTGYGKGHNLLAQKEQDGYLSLMNPDIIVTPDHFFHLLTPFSDSTVGLTEARQTPFEHPKQVDPETGETAWSSGACFVIPAPLFHRLGGFDDASFFMYSEDVDLSLRIREQGLRLIYCPNAPAFHAKQADSQGLPQETTTEQRFSPEAQLVLSYKWRNRRRVKRLLAIYKKGTPLQQAAAASFLQRQKANTLLQVKKKPRFFRWKELRNRF